MQDNKMKGYIVSMQKEEKKHPRINRKSCRDMLTSTPRPASLPVLPINYLLNIKAEFKANNKTNKLSLLLAKLNAMDVWSDLNMETDWECARFKLN